MASTTKNYLDLSKILIVSGADVNVKNNAGLTVFSMAESLKVNDTIKEYLKKTPHTRKQFSKR